MVGTWHGLVIDTEDTDTLASFYQELLGFVRVQDDPDFTVIGDAPDRPGIAFQRVDRHVRPQWPDADHPAQMHIDVRVKDIDEAEPRVLALGARATGYQAEHHRVYLDPSGHPFCLAWW